MLVLTWLIVAVIGGGGEEGFCGLKIFEVLMAPYEVYPKFSRPIRHL